MLLVVTLLRERLSFRGLRKLTKELWQVAHILNAQLGGLLPLIALGITEIYLGLHSQL